VRFFWLTSTILALPDWSKCVKECCGIVFVFQIAASVA